ncbi:MAG: hypothetical protein ABI828_00560 [Actinomycetota bacterium]
MNLTDTVTGAKDSAMHRMSEMRLDRTAKENDELKTENRLLRDELAENRSERKHVLDMLDKANISVAEPSKRRFKLLRLVAVGGAVYTVVTKTGAVERVRGWVDAARGKTEALSADMQGKAADATHRVGDTVEHAGRKIEGTGEKIEKASGANEKP